MRGATRRASCFSAIAAALVIGVSACLGQLDVPQQLLFSDALEEHVWTIILTSDSGRVWLVQSDTAGGHPASLEDTVSASLWTTLDGYPDRTNLTLHISRRAGGLAWELDYLGATVSSGEGQLTSDALYWVPRSQGRATLSYDGAVQSVAFDMIGGTPLPSQPVVDPLLAASDTVRAPAIVSLRMDDCSETDAQSFHVLQDLNLTAEIAVPSKFVNRPGSCSVELLNAMVAAGNVVESHSRTHGATPRNFGDFYLEVVGSGRDLRAWGYNPHDFIQPGSWNTGPASFDTPAKLQTQYAALVRRVYVAMEAYTPKARSVSIPVPDRFGPQPYPIGQLTPLSVDSLVRAAASNHVWIEFMWHSRETPPAVLAARLAAIAALRDSGLVAVMPFYAVLHATH